MNKKLIIGLVVLLSLLFPTPTFAVCPICTVAVTAGLGLSRVLGIDDVISSIWIGGLILSSGLWLADWLKKKKEGMKNSELISLILMYLLVLGPLYFTGFFKNTGSLWGVNKLILGTIVGSVIFLIGVVGDKILRKINEGKVFIYYQKVIVPVLLLSFTSFIFYLITS
jgi:hypothetical protein